MTSQWGTEQRGGKRNGAGRKSTFVFPHRTTVTMEDELNEQLESFAKIGKMSKGEIIRTALQQYLKKQEDVK